MIIGGSNNFIDDNSSNVELFNSVGVETANIDNFMGVNLDANSTVVSNAINLADSLIIYSDGLAASKPRVLRVTSDFTVDGSYSIYEIDLDSIGVDITCTWDAVATVCQVVFKVVSNTGGLDFIIDDISSPPSSPPQTIDGQSLPHTTGLIENESITVYSNGTNLKVI
jgi:hypothetical protein